MDKLQIQVVDTFHCELNSIGSDVNPIIREKDFVKKSQVEKMVAHMISLYRSMYYSEKHNCFLFYDQSIGLNVFDMCGNEFIGKHNLMNIPNGTNAIIVKGKINDRNLPQYYANSIYNWLEIGAPLRLLHTFPYIRTDSDGYLYSSFALWGEGNTQIMQPLSMFRNKGKLREYDFFDNETFNSLMDPTVEPIANEYERLLWKYIHKRDSLSLDDVSLLTADPLISEARYCLETFLYTPIAIYIIRQVLRFN